MKYKLIIIIAIAFLSMNLISSSHLFYKNLSDEGKRLYMAGKYEEAIENFRIAEFGLMENKGILKEMYLYYSLAHFKLSNGDEVIELTDKLKDLTGVSSFEVLKFPKVISEDLDTMFSVIDRTYKKAVSEIPEKKQPAEKSISSDKRKEFLKVYRDTRESLNGNDLGAGKTGLKRLKKLNRNDIRTKFLSGVVFFRENKYKKAINELLPVSRFGTDELKDESSYYLALSNYFEKNYGQFLAFYQKINDKNINGKLSEIIKKVRDIRKEGIDVIKKKFFNRKSFKNFSGSFNGDISLASDILAEVLGIIPLRIRDIYYMADSVIRFPGIYDRAFILKIADLFMEREQEEYAIDILKRSRFFKKESAKNIEILYKLGLIYHDIGNMKRSKKMMHKVYNINNEYKRVNYYLTNGKS